MSREYRVIEVKQMGRSPIVAFRVADPADEATGVAFVDEINHVIRETGCRTLTLDLSGLKTVRSSFLGHLVALRRRVKIRLRNASEYVRLVLQTSQFDKLFEIE